MHSIYKSCRFTMSNQSPNMVYKNRVPSHLFSFIIPDALQSWVLPCEAVERLTQVTTVVTFAHL